MKQILLAICIAMTGLAHGQALEFKGSRFGESQAEFRDKQPGLQCPWPKQTCDVMDWSAPEGRDDAMMTYAGEPMRAVEAQFEDGRLMAVTIEVKSESFDSVRTALVGKYGRPTSTLRSKVKTKIGATFDQVVVSWIRKDGVIRLSRYGDTIETGVVSLRSAEWVKKQAGKNAEAERKAAADL